MKHVVLLFGLILAQIVGLQAQDKIYFHKDRHTQSWELTEVDSVTYLKPAGEVTIPKSLTLEGGTKVKLTYMVSDGIEEESIVWRSSDSRIAYFQEEYVHGVCEGNCVLLATYKGVTSRCYVTVAGQKEDITTVAECMEKMLFWSSLQTYSVAEVAAYMSQALTTGNNSQSNTPAYRNGWNFLNDTYTSHPWHEYTRYILPSYERICNSGVKSYELVATTLYLHSLMQMVDMYGVAPIKGMYKSHQRDYFYINYRSYNPTYYDMSTTYAFMDSTFNALLEKYSDSEWTSGEGLSYDPYYSGDLQKWEALTKALYARLMLRKLPNWENNLSTCNKIINMVDDVMTDWEEARHYYPDYNYTHFYTSNFYCPWGPRASSYNSWETRSNVLSNSIPTTFFLYGLLGGIGGTYQTTRGYALDPRATKMMEQSYNRKNNSMLHIESNKGMDITESLSNFPSLIVSTNPYTNNYSYIPLITTEELLFIKAEAQYWSGDVMGAYATTVAATKKNMERYGLNETDIQAEVEGKNLKNQYNRFFNIKLPNASQFTIADLMQQKYVSMYLQPEQWTDMRRYNYSSSSNGIAYNGVYVYDVKNVHNGRVATFEKDSTNFCLSYSLRRPYNLYENCWFTEDDFGKNAQLSPNAWVMQLPITVDKYNKEALEKIGYKTPCDVETLKKRPIWAQKHDGPATSADSNITWK